MSAVFPRLSHGLRRRILQFILPVAMTALLAPHHALAQNVDAVKMAQGQALYDEALKDMEARNYNVACPKFQQVIRLVPEGIGARITLAECFEAQGKKASAWVSYREAQAMAKAAGQKDRENKAKTRAEALEGTLAKLSIVVPEELARLPGLKIERDGEPLDSALWNTPFPVDKGEHTIHASADGKNPWQKTVTVSKDGDIGTVEVGPFTAKEPQRPAESPGHSETTAPKGPGASSAAPLYGPPGGAQTAGTAAPPANTTVVVDPTARRIIGIGLGVVGLGAVAGGAYVFKAAVDKQNSLYDSFRCLEAQGICVDNESTTALNEAEDNSLLGIGLMIGGGVAAVIGIVVFATADSYVGAPGKDPFLPAGEGPKGEKPPPARKRQTQSVSMSLSLGLGSAMLRGRW